MSTRRRKPDPKLVALLEQRAKALAEGERWYARLKRAFGRVEKARQRAARLLRRIEQRSAALEQET